MFSHVIVAVDGGQGGRDATALARRLAAPGARIELTHVEGSDVGRRIPQLAARRGADLLVVGASGRARLGRMLLGDAGRAALNGARCAIAIAPRGYLDGAGEIAKVGVGYDGSAESAIALRAARQIAARHGVKVRARWVVPLQGIHAETTLPTDWTETTAELIGRCAQRLDELGDLDGAAVYGQPGEELERFGGELDLLVVGTRRQSPIDRLVRGSISRRLADHPPCPLLAVPPSAGSDINPAPVTDDAEL